MATGNKISPFAAIATPVGRSKVPVPLPPVPILPSIINTLPFWPSLRASCPRTTPAALRTGMPSTVCLSLTSLTHRLPSLSTVPRSLPISRFNIYLIKKLNTHD